MYIKGNLMKTSLTLSGLLAFVLIACSNTAAPIASDDCAAADAHLQALGCIPKGQPYTANNKTFTQFCEDTMKNGIDLSPKCIAQVNSCNQINACVQHK
jgi:hypothetical protein